MLVAEQATQEQISDAPTLLAKKVVIKNELNELLAKISENIQINKIATLQVEEHGLINSYIHPGSTVGVLIELATDHDPTVIVEELKVIARDLCMQVAVTHPLCVSQQELDQTAVAKERSILQEQLKDSKKPANIIKKIIDGKLNKWYQDVCLMNQRYIKNDEITINNYLAELSEKLKNEIVIKRFIRFFIGR